MHLGEVAHYNMRNRVRPTDRVIPFKTVSAYTERENKWTDKWGECAALQNLMFAFCLPYGDGFTNRGKLNTVKTIPISLSRPKASK